MSALYFNNITLLENQNGGVTGKWFPMARSRDALFTSYANATTGSITLQYKSPFFDEGVSFYVITMGSGYATPTFSTSPIGEIRAISSGSGKYWCAVTQQN